MNLKNSRIAIKIFAHVETWRPYTTIWAGLVSLVGASIIYRNFPPINIAILSFFIPIIGWISGLYLSDFLDRDLDLIQKPHRPIPSNRIKPDEALIIGAIFALVGGFSTLFLLNIINVIIVYLTAILVFTYAKISKSKGIFGNINRGIITLGAYYFGVFSINPEFYLIPPFIFILSIIFLIHDTNSNIIGALRDLEGDKRGGYLTIPVKYGVNISILISSILSFIWIFMIIYLQINFKFLKFNFYPIFILDIVLILYLYFNIFKNLKSITREKSLTFHEIFVIERIVLASSFIYGLVDIQIASLIFILSLLITIITQMYLRKKYEFKLN